MRRTLRRSCAACAKAKHSCDLQTPKCSRCIKRGCSCVYINEPLTSAVIRSGDDTTHGIESQALQAHRTHAGASELGRSKGTVSPDISNNRSLFFEAHLFDPFESYPTTNLPRIRVQSLMQHFLSKIAFHYYPLDLNPSSNPFVTSWWPLALTDPALFHVTLQTASLDEELHARKGFPQSELLMNDSVSLLRRKVQHQSLAFQDATMNAVVTLAAIEYGKGNLDLSKMHVDGVKGMVAARGGLSQVKRTSPLTARMVPWVSMVITGSPQFDTQDDMGEGEGVCVIEQWKSQVSNEVADLNSLDLASLGLDPVLQITINRLRSIFGVLQQGEYPVVLSTTDLHDLTCFTLHRLLSLPRFSTFDVLSGNISECLRYGVAIYMFLIHGPTYYSHANLLNTLVLQLRHYLSQLSLFIEGQESLFIWLLSVGAVASIGTNESQWFLDETAELSAATNLYSWSDVESHLKRILWRKSTAWILFQQTWEEGIFKSNLSPHNVAPE